MAKYHSTLSRREFLKALGLGGAGLGASAALGSVAPWSGQPVRDLDEMIASPSATFVRPSWVKEVDKPTVEVNWQGMKRFDYHFVMWAAGLKTALGRAV
jgi:disulfide bond formation protein DsbB